MRTNDFLEAIVLGIVQGLTEFLPVSSTGHLVIFERLLERFLGEGTTQLGGLSLDVALHVGTLASILVVYRRDLISLRRRPRLCGMIVLASLPAAVVGLVWADQFETAFRSPRVAGFGLLLTALWLMTAERLGRGVRTIDGIRPREALGIGVCQALALVPGVSRSGSTIAGGVLLGVERNAACTFSFLIAVPAIAGAGALTARRAWAAGFQTASLAPLAAGMLVAFVVGWIALHWLIRAVAKGRLHWFAIYCFTVGLTALLWQAG